MFFPIAILTLSQFFIVPFGYISFECVVLHILVFLLSWFIHFSLPGEREHSSTCDSFSNFHLKYTDAVACYFGHKPISTMHTGKSHVSSTFRSHVWVAVCIAKIDSFSLGIGKQQRNGKIYGTTAKLPRGNSSKRRITKPTNDIRAEWFRRKKAKHAHKSTHPATKYSFE